MEFPYGRSCLHKLLKEIGFSFKFRGKERLIYERSDIIAWRERYLRAIKKFRENNPDKDIVYTTLTKHGLTKATERRKSESIWKA